MKIYKEMICIYKITSPSGAINIGQTWNIKIRFKIYSNNNCKGQIKLYNSLKKYGWDNHQKEILVTLNENISQETLDWYETFWWKIYKDAGFEMMNIKKPGSKGKHSKDTIKKMKNSHLGKKLTKEHIENLKKPRPGSGPKGPRLDSTKIKIKNSKKGIKYSEERNKKLKKS
ncbi:MAG TPA: hypothetical protein VFV86_07505, partial [Nitrososphaeraceae archaeon]|nr:hypothetical protein [Nitrososphaeraceae archaeon]